MDRENRRWNLAEKYIGRKHGKLTVLGYAGYVNNQHRLMLLCRCDCGNLVERHYHTLMAKAANPQCPECQKGHTMTQHQHDRFKSIQASARTRKIKFKLTAEQFVASFYGKCCYLCGDEAFGIDRVDSSIGYEVGNMEPCCTRCNLMKNDTGLNDFLTHIEKIKKHMEAKKS